jgi:hypothetical protein
MKAKARYLLLLDSSGASPLQKVDLRKTFDKFNAGKEKFPRTSVRIIYANPSRNGAYHFLCHPWKS